MRADPVELGTGGGQRDDVRPRADTLDAERGKVSIFEQEVVDLVEGVGGHGGLAQAGVNAGEGFGRDGAVFDGLLVGGINLVQGIAGAGRAVRDVAGHGVHVEREFLVGQGALNGVAEAGPGIERDLLLHFLHLLVDFFPARVGLVLHLGQVFQGGFDFFVCAIEIGGDFADVVADLFVFLHERVNAREDFGFEAAAIGTVFVEENVFVHIYNGSEFV